MIIRNRKQLLSHGDKKGREIALDIAEHGIAAVNVYKATKQKVRIRNGKLTAENLSYDISRIEDIYVIGGGKATFPIAQALDEILGDRIEKGYITVKRGEKRRLEHIKVVEAGHPLPDEAGLIGAQEMVNIADEAEKGDLVFCAITGGASALMPLPVDTITLEDKKRVTQMLLECGATIDEINAVRNHISEIKGGRLAQHIHPAEIVNLIVMDEIAGRPWGPTAADPTTAEDAVRTLRKYELWKRTPTSVRKHLERAVIDKNLETPKPKDFECLKVHNIILADNCMMCEAAERRAKELGFNTLVLSTKLEGESREAGIVLASIAREVEERGRPVNPPAVLILGGETTVTIVGQHGKGGPSQELVLGSALKIAKNRETVVVSIDTDGSDGPTETAGGIVDSLTLKRCERRGIDLFKSLMRHNSYDALRKLDDAIITGPTETNVMDLNLLVVMARARVRP